MNSMQEYAQGTLTAVTSFPCNVIIGPLAAILGLYFIRRFFAGGVCYSKASLTRRTVIITGGNTGIGKSTAIDLAKRNARIILVCRDVEKGETAVLDIRRESGNDNVVFRQLDLASFASIRQFAALILEEEPRIDILINNAGVFLCPYTLTQDGFEMQFGVNHLGHFLLTNLLLERIKESSPARIVNVSSVGYKSGKMDFEDLNWKHRPYYRLGAYCQSKLANILFTKALAKRLDGTDVIANTLHPGAVNTEIQRHAWILVSHLSTTYCLETYYLNSYSSMYVFIPREDDAIMGMKSAYCGILTSRFGWVS